jgi:hypothetical protein
MKEKMHGKEKEYWILGFGLLTLAFILYFIIIPWQIKPQPGELISSDIFPKFATIILAILGIGFLYDANKLRRVSRTDPVEYSTMDEKNAEKMDWASFFMSTGVLLVYTLSLYLLGFIISTMLFLVLTMWRFGVGPVWKCSIIAATMVLIFGMLFQSFMLIRLPQGLLVRMLMRLF